MKPPLLFLRRMLVPLLAVAAAAQASTPDGQHRCFRIMSVVGTVSDLKYDPDVHTKPISLRIHPGPSDPLPLPDGDSLELYRLVPPPPEAPPGTKPAKSNAATLALPPGHEPLLVIVALSPDKTLTYKILTDSLADHPAGTFRLVNFSRMPAALHLNGRLYSIKTGQNQIVPYGSGGTRIEIAVQKGSRWAMAFDKARIARPTLHAYAFIFDYIKDTEIDNIGPPPPALVRFFTEKPFSKATAPHP